MADPPMPPIRRLGEDAVQLTHPLREIPLRRFEDEVVVVRHQTIGVTEPVEPLDDLRQHLEKGLAVPVVLVDRLTPIAARRDVI